MLNQIKAVISTLEDVIYPAHIYHGSACRAGADFVRRLFGINISDKIAKSYRPGHEEEAMRTALEGCFGSEQSHVVRTAALAMKTHFPRIAPYEDALETFSLLNAMNIKLGLLCPGPSYAERSKVHALRLNAIFKHIILPDEIIIEDSIAEAIYLLEVFLETPLKQTAFITAASDTATQISDSGIMGCVYYIERNRTREMQCTGFQRIEHLFELPEKLGLVLDHEAGISG